MLNWFITYWSSSIEPAVRDAFESTLKFLSLWHIDPTAASPFASKAIATAIALIITFVALWRALRALDRLMRALGKVMADFLIAAKERVVEMILNKLLMAVEAILSPDFWLKVRDWFAMISPATANVISAGSQGDTRLLFQRNLGLAALGVTLFSTCAFAFAVFRTTALNGVETASSAPIVMSAALIYFLIIMTVERAVIAPFENGSLALAATAFIMRIGLAFLIASFSAIPLTAYLHAGAIQEVLNGQVEGAREAVQTQLTRHDASVTDAQTARLSSSACVGATAAVQSADNAVQAAMRSGCRGGLAVCPSTLTSRAEAIYKARLETKAESCNLPSEVLAAYATRRSELSKQLSSIAEAKAPDMLQASKVLNTFAMNEEEQWLKPVHSTYYLLLGLELAGVGIKLLGEIVTFKPSFGRRRRSLRRGKFVWPWAKNDKYKDKPNVLH